MKGDAADYDHLATAAGAGRRRGATAAGAEQQDGGGAAEGGAEGLASPGDDAGDARTPEWVSAAVGAGAATGRKTTKRGGGGGAAGRATGKRGAAGGRPTTGRATKRKKVRPRGLLAAVPRQIFWHALTFPSLLLAQVASDTEPDDDDSGEEFIPKGTSASDRRLRF